MIKSRHSAVIVIVVISLLSCSWLRAATAGAGHELQQLSIEDVQHDELISPSQADRLSDTESKLIALQEELTALKKSLRCIQCESDPQDQTPLPLVPAKSSPIISSSRQIFNRKRLWARQATASSQRQQANFLRGEPGEPGKNGLDGVPGLDGASGLDGVPGVDGRNGRDGHDGRDGKDGKDGLDGQPGERGPPGPAGSPGETGRRGKPGPPGAQGPPGPAGVCAYKAAFDCSLLSQSANQSSEALLVAPVMIGGESNGRNSKNQLASADEDRQVFVNEGEHIQLSCEAFGQPKPDYVWRKSGGPSSGSGILLDPSTSLKVTSFRGGQLPLINVDRLQSGSYECLASNGIPPEASKRINLNVNYAPTVRLSPGPSIYQVELGSSLLIECIVDANPPPLSYWMFGSDLIMSIPQQQQQQQPQPSHGDQRRDHHRRHKQNKYIITESAGQLASGASYIILTLNITNIEQQDLGEYKCSSKNLIGQSVGHALLESSHQQQQLSPPSRQQEMELRKLRQLILEHSFAWGRDVANSWPPLEDGWPAYLVERVSQGVDAASSSARYSVFGNEHRQRVGGANTGSLNKKLIDELLADLRKITRISDSDTTERNQIFTHRDDPVTRATDTPPMVATPEESESDDGLCRIELPLARGDKSDERRTNVLLLDQVGKPVYVGSMASDRSIDWWSMDAAVRLQNNAGDQFYATVANITDRLFEYDSMADLLKGPNEPNSGGSRAYELKYPINGQSRLVYNGCFIYTTLNAADGDSPRSRLSDLMIVVLDLRTNEYSYIDWSGENGVKLRQLFEQQPLELRADDQQQQQQYKMSRIEICSDENGVWLIIPTLFSTNRAPSIWRQPTIIGDNSSSTYRTRQREVSPASTFDLPKMTRRLHAIKISSSLFDSRTTTTAQQSKPKTATVEIEHHTSMKLDWSMIGQMFIIDGVLYGIKDRHLYSSKLQFAYDLYKCKLLSSEYLNEPHRTWTNHFGNTQMINYHPNEPKRLYTIDNGNLLWCPVKLIKTNPNEI